MRQGPIPGARGRVRPLTLLGDPVLHAPCEEVTDFGPELAALVEDLFATMYAAQGVGLAANQVGVPLRVFVYDCPDDEEVRHVGHVVNPRLVEADGMVLRGPEGCLSLPGLEAGTERYDHAVVEGFTVTGRPGDGPWHGVLRKMPTARVRPSGGPGLRGPPEGLAPPHA